jgi:hypothetical protein
MRWWKCNRLPTQDSLLLLLPFLSLVILSEAKNPRFLPLLCFGLFAFALDSLLSPLGLELGFSPASGQPQSGSRSAECSSEAQRAKRLKILPCHCLYFSFPIFRPKNACQAPKALTH